MFNVKARLVFQYLMRGDFAIGNKLATQKLFESSGF